MSAVNTVSWFEIGAPDVEAAKAFYGPLFGWSFAADYSSRMGAPASHPPANPSLAKTSIWRASPTD